MFTKARPLLRYFRSVPPRRHFSAPTLNRWGTILNLIGIVYFGGLIICGGSLYLLYSDASSRQTLPREIGVSITVAAVKAIGKDDVLKSPRHAVKHYRRLLIELARAEKPDLHFVETLSDGLPNYAVPLISAETLLNDKSKAFENFYTDMVLRYARVLLTKGQLRVSVALLKGMVDDDRIFYQVGDPERMSQCCRVLSRVAEDSRDRLRYLERSVKMLVNTFQNIHVDSDFLLAADSQLTDELLRSLNAMAFTHARNAGELPNRKRAAVLGRALNINLANLQAVTQLRDRIVDGSCTQSSYPLMNCDIDHLNMLLAEIKSHVSEILWARGIHTSAIAWGEEVVHDIYFDHSRVPQASPILDSVLRNLAVMYGKTKRADEVRRCDALRQDLVHFYPTQTTWYDSLVQRFTKIIYYKGPLGVIEKALKERVGMPLRVPDIEEYEDEDEEF